MIRRRVNQERGRYYIAVVSRDLFGGWDLQRFWGGCDSRRGGSLSQHLEDPEAIEDRDAPESQGQGGLFLARRGRSANRRQKRNYVVA